MRCMRAYDVLCQGRASIHRMTGNSLDVCVINVGSIVCKYTPAGENAIVNLLGSKRVLLRIALLSFVF